MTYLLKCSIFSWAVASFVDDDDHVQLIQTRILQKSLDDPKSLDEPVVFPNCSNWGLLHFIPEEQCQYTAAELLTPDGENKCLNLESSSEWANWDCNGVGDRHAMSPASCKTSSYAFVAEKCCKDECGFFEAAVAKSKLESECLNNQSIADSVRTGWAEVEWTDWDCEGIGVESSLSKYAGFTRNAAAPAFCKYSDDCQLSAHVTKCCPDFCKPDSPSTGFPDIGFTADGAVVMKKVVIPLPDVSTIEGQASCLHTYGGFGGDKKNEYSCRTSPNKSAAFPTYCNTTASRLRLRMVRGVDSGATRHSSPLEKAELLKVRATDSICCQTDCNWNEQDLLTSDGENKCLNLEGSGWDNWDCNGLDGRNAATGYCAVASKPEVSEKCCKDECEKKLGSASTVTTPTTPVVTRCGASMGAPTTSTTTLDLTSSAGQTLCLNTYSSGWNGWDCEGTGGTNAAAPAYCDSANAEYRKAVAQVCCAPYCVSVSSTTTTTIPGDGTNPGGVDCFGAIASWGPDFDCNEKSDMFCGHDSADGLDVSLCCQDHCGTKQERHSKKKEAEADRKEAEATRKSTRQESSSKRKDAESTRKKQKKEDEWLSKRSAQERENKKSEDERKSKRGFSEGEKKKERSWKAKRGADKEAAEKREASRKRNRNEKKKKFANSEALNKKNNKDSVNKAEKKKKGRRAEKKKKRQN